jgi:chromosomal replication initiation ATPase DnaA
MREIKLVEKIILKSFGFENDEIKSQSRTARIIFARFIFCHICYRHLDMTLIDIGDYTGRNHTTIIQALAKHDKYIETKTMYKKHFTEILRKVKKDILEIEFISVNDLFRTIDIKKIA